MCPAALLRQLDQAKPRWPSALMCAHARVPVHVRRGSDLCSISRHVETSCYVKKATIQGCVPCPVLPPARPQGGHSCWEFRWRVQRTASEWEAVLVAVARSWSCCTGSCSNQHMMKLQRAVHTPTCTHKYKEKMEKSVKAHEGTWSRTQHC